MRNLTLTLVSLLFGALPALAQCNLQIDTVSIEHPYCPGTPTGWIFLMGSGGTPPYDFHWDNGFFGPEQNGLQAGTYQVTLVDGEGCTAEETIELVAGLTADAGPAQTVYCEPSVEIGSSPAGLGRIGWDGSLEPLQFLDGSGAALNYGLTDGYVGMNIPIPNLPSNQNGPQLQVESVQAQLGDQICLPVTVEQFAALSAFSFTLNFEESFLQLDTVLNLNAGVPGFSAAAHFSFSAGAVGVEWAADNLGLTAVADGDTLFLLCLTVVGAPQDLTFNWVGPNGFADDNPGTTVAESGVYTLRVTDNSQPDCWAEDGVAVHFLDSLKVSLGDTLFYCEGQPITLSAEVEGGGGSLEYAWSNGVTTPAQTVMPTPGAVYGLTVTDGSGCVGLDSVVLFPAEDLEIESVGVLVFCENEPFTFAPTVTGGVPPYTFNWGTGDTTSALFIFDPGNYNLTVTDANGCATERNFEALAFPVPTVELPSVVTQCPGEITTLMPEVSGGTPPFQYSWNTGSTSAVITVSPEQSATFRVSVTNEADGCFGMAQTFIEVSGIDAGISVSDCEDNGTPSDLSDDTFTFTLTATGGSSGSWVGVIGGEAESGLYGTEYVFGPYLVEEGDVQVVLSDAGNTDCATNFLVEPPDCAPAPCIFEAISSVIVNCDANGTPGQPNDDRYDIEFLVSNTTSGGRNLLPAVWKRYLPGYLRKPLADLN